MIKLRIINNDEVVVKRKALEDTKEAEAVMLKMAALAERQQEAARFKARTDRWGMIATVIVLLAIVALAAYQTHKENS